MSEVRSRLMHEAKAFYDPTSDRLYLIPEAFADGEPRRVLFHELIHALDDQHFDLVSLRRNLWKVDPTDFIYLALVEGSARYVTALSHGQDLSRQVPAETRLSQVNVRGRGEASRRLSACYEIGAAFVARRVRRHGPGALDGLFREPPGSQSELLRECGAGSELDWEDCAALDPRATPPPRTIPVGEIDLALWIQRLAGSVAGGKAGPVSPDRGISESTECAANGLDCAWLVAIARHGETGAFVLLTHWRTRADASEAAQTLHGLLARNIGVRDIAAFRSTPDGTDSVSYSSDAISGSLHLRGKSVFVIHGVAPTRLLPLWQIVRQAGFRSPVQRK